MQQSQWEPLRTGRWVGRRPPWVPPFPQYSPLPGGLGPLQARASLYLGKRRGSTCSGAQRESKLVAWVASNWAPGYIQPRVSCDQELKKQLPVDVYGRGHEPLPGSRLLPTVSQYKFYLAFEHSRHEDYISEKVWRNAFLSGAVPIVMLPPPGAGRLPAGTGPERHA